MYQYLLNHLNPIYYSLEYNISNVTYLELSTLKNSLFPPTIAEYQNISQVMFKKVYMEALLVTCRFLYDWNIGFIHTKQNILSYEKIADYQWA